MKTRSGLIIDGAEEFNYVVDFYGATAAQANGGRIASGASATATITIDGGTDFLVDQLLFSAFFSAAQSFTSTVGLGGVTTTLQTPVKLPRTGSPTIASATNPPLDMIRLEFKANDKSWQSAPMRSSLITGEPGFLMPKASPIILRAKTTLTIVAYNDLAVTASVVGGITAPTVDAQLILNGLKVPMGFNL